MRGRAKRIEMRTWVMAQAVFILLWGGGCGGGQGRELTGDTVGLGTGDVEETEGPGAPPDSGSGSDTEDPDDACVDECAEDETCLAGACCPEAAVCGDTCCGGQE